MAEILEAMQEVTLHHPEQCRLMTLPSEIFLRIIDYLGGDGEEGPSRGELDLRIKQLSSVSSSFRAAVLNTTSFWTTITNDYVLRRGFEERISRSRNAPLQLDLRLSDIEPWEEILSLTLPYKDRWRLLHAYVQGNAGSIAIAFPHLRFPCLESLRLHFDGSDDSDKFFSEWSFLNVIGLELRNAIPPPGLFNKLIAFSLWAINIPDELSVTFLTRITDFLSYLHLLEDLFLNFTTIVEHSPVEFSVAELPMMKHACIQNYTGGFLYGRVSAQTIGNLLKSIRIPNVETFSVDIRFFEGERMVNWVDSFSGAKEVLKSVTSLRVVMLSAMDEQSIVLFFGLFPNLQMLTVDVQGFVSSLLRLRSELNLDRLETLRISGNALDIPWNWESDLYKVTRNTSQLNVLFYDGFTSPL